MFDYIIVGAGAGGVSWQAASPRIALAACFCLKPAARMTTQQSEYRHIMGAFRIALAIGPTGQFRKRIYAGAVSSCLKAGCSADQAPSIT